MIENFLGINKEKTTHTVKCHVTCNTDGGVPEVRADNWPQRLFMQLIPKNFIQTIGMSIIQFNSSKMYPVDILQLFSFQSIFLYLLLGGQFLRNARAVAFNPEPSESLDVLTRVLQVQQS